jgi:3-oxoacyl-[acyl-carrier protein] reductase
MDLGLVGKRALVTGSNRGTGAVIARVLAAEGATVLVHGNHDGEQTDIAHGIADSAGRAHAITGDIGTDEGARRAVEAAMAATAGVDILVNNLGQASGGRWDTADPADFIAAYQVNTLSAVRMIRAFVPEMRSRGFGRVIQITTIGTTRPNARMPEYYAAKAALANITVSLAKDLAGSGVTVNTVSPGLIHTPETESYLRHLAGKRGWGDRWDDIEANGVRELTGAAVRRMARPEEVAALVAFLASAHAAYLNGANFRVDGGATDIVQ